MNTATNAIEPKVWLQNRPVKVELLVHDFIVNKALNNPREFNHFHPSAWGSCLRKIAYQYYNQHQKFLEKTPQDVDDRYERIFDNGHGVHHRWQDYLDRAGYLRGVWRCKNPLCGAVYGEGERLGIFNPSGQPDWVCKCGSKERLGFEEILVKTDPQYKFEGHCDAVIDVRGSQYETGGPYDIFVADMKSMKDDQFSELTEPKLEHIVQVNIYMWILDLQGAVLIYENKNSQYLKEMFVPRDNDLIERIKSQSLWLQEVLKQGKLPHRPNGFFRSRFPCMLCEFVNHCYQ